MAWMYILECADGSYYVGSTKNLEQRNGNYEMLPPLAEKKFEKNKIT